MRLGPVVPTDTRPSGPRLGSTPVKPFGGTIEEGTSCAVI
jgi:hypothetical protein